MRKAVRLAVTSQSSLAVTLGSSLLLFSSALVPGGQPATVLGRDVQLNAACMEFAIGQWGPEPKLSAPPLPSRHVPTALPFYQSCSTCNLTVKQSGGDHRRGRAPRATSIASGSKRPSGLALPAKSPSPPCVCHPRSSSLALLTGAYLKLSIRRVAIPSCRDSRGAASCSRTWAALRTRTTGRGGRNEPRNPFTPRQVGAYQWNEAEGAYTTTRAHGPQRMPEFQPAPAAIRSATRGWSGKAKIDGSFRYRSPHPGSTAGVRWKSRRQNKLRRGPPPPRRTHGAGRADVPRVT